MINKELLLKVAADMAALAESIKTLAESEAVVENTKVDKEEKRAKAKPAEEKKPETKAEPEKKYTLEDVRKVLAAKAGAGFTAEVRALLEKHGGAKLSKIQESEYEAIINEAKEIV